MQPFAPLQTSKPRLRVHQKGGRPTSKGLGVFLWRQRNYGLMVFWVHNSYVMLHIYTLNIITVQLLYTIICSRIYDLIVMSKQKGYTPTNSSKLEWHLSPQSNPAPALTWRTHEKNQEITPTKTLEYLPTSEPNNPNQNHQQKTY